MAVLNFYHIGKTIPKGAVYIGRGNSSLGLVQSKFSNPFPAKNKEDRDRVVDLYKKWLWKQIKEGKITRDELIALDGKDLVCYCSPKSCHGDVLTKAIEWACLSSKRTQPSKNKPNTY